MVRGDRTEAIMGGQMTYKGSGPGGFRVSWNILVAISFVGLCVYCFLCSCSSIVSFSS